MDYKELLKKHDHPTRWEHPPGFEYRAASLKFERMVAELSALLDVPIQSESGVQIQDASFHCQAFIPLAGEHRAVIRCSNFGGMATVSVDEPVPEDTMRIMTDLLNRHDYVYIPEIELQERYTGENPGVTGIDSWWIRFFDYV